MIIYKGWYYFRKNKGSIRKIDMINGYHGILSGCVYHDEWDIQVNKNDCLEEQVKSILEELAHLGLEHNVLLTESLDEKYKAQKDEIEGKSKTKKIINTEIKNFYSRNPPLIKFIKNLLQPKIPKNKHIQNNPRQLKLFN